MRGLAAALALVTSTLLFATATRAFAQGVPGATTSPPEAAPAPRLERPPKLLRFVEAEPPAALAERREVAVVLTIDVDETGKVVKVDVARSGGDDFDDAAVQAARQFLFAPGEAGGKPVPVRITYEYKFLYKPIPGAPLPPGTPPPGTPRVELVPVDGRVLRAGDRTPLGGIAVLADDGALTTTTNAAGRFRVLLPAGAHVLHVAGPEIQKSDFSVT
ncbi:MAG TPA: energy transducer TonB, partial [Polyangia bacterium]